MFWRQQRLDALGNKIGKERHRQWHRIPGVLPIDLLHGNDGLGHSNGTPDFSCGGKVTTLFAGKIQVTTTSGDG